MAKKRKETTKKKPAPVEPVLPTRKVRITDKREVATFVRDLKEAASQSARTGAIWSAFLHTQLGVLEFEVQLPVGAQA